jgi:hypothetical protein
VFIILQVNAGAHDLEEFLKRPLRFAVFTGGQIAGDEGTKCLSAGQIALHIDLLRLAIEWIAARRIGRVRVAIVTAPLGVNDVAA